MHLYAPVNEGQAIKLSTRLTPAKNTPSPTPAQQQPCCLWQKCLEVKLRSSHVERKRSAAVIELN